MRSASPARKMRAREEERVRERERERERGREGVERSKLSRSEI